MKLFKFRFCLTPLRTSRVQIPTSRLGYYIVVRVYVFGFLVAEFHEK